MEERSRSRSRSKSKSRSNSVSKKRSVTPKRSRSAGSGKQRVKSPSIKKKTNDIKSVLKQTKENASSNGNDRIFNIRGRKIGKGGFKSPVVASDTGVKPFTKAVDIERRIDDKGTEATGSVNILFVVDVSALSNFIWAVIDCAFSEQNDGTTGNGYQNLFWYYEAVFESFPVSGMYPKIILEVAAALEGCKRGRYTYQTTLNGTVVLPTPGGTGVKSNWTDYSVAAVSNYFPVGTALIKANLNIASAVKLQTLRGAQLELVSVSNYNTSKTNIGFDNPSIFADFVNKKGAQITTDNNFYSQANFCASPVNVIALEVPITHTWMAMLGLVQYSGTGYRTYGLSPGCIRSVYGSMGSTVWVRMKMKKSGNLYERVIFKSINGECFIQRFLNWIDQAQAFISVALMPLASYSTKEWIYLAQALLYTFFREYSTFALGFNQATAGYCNYGISDPVWIWDGGRIPEVFNRNLAMLRPKIIGGFLYVPVLSSDNTYIPAGQVAWSNAAPAAIQTLQGLNPMAMGIQDAIMADYNKLIKGLSGGCRFVEPSFLIDSDDTIIDIVFTSIYTLPYSLINLGQSMDRPQSVLKSLIKDYECPSFMTSDGSPNDAYFQVRYTQKYIRSVSNYTLKYITMTGTDNTAYEASWEYFVPLSASVSNLNPRSNQMLLENKSSILDKDMSNLISNTDDNGPDENNVIPPSFIKGGWDNTVLEARAGIVGKMGGGHNIPQILSNVTDKFGLKYGNYGGPNSPSIYKDPIDLEDYYYMVHDAMYQLADTQADIKEADIILYNKLASHSTKSKFGYGAQSAIAFKYGIGYKQKEGL